MITVLDLRDSPWVDGPGRTILDCATDLRTQDICVIIGAFDSGGSRGTDYQREARERGLQVEVIREKRSLDTRVLGQVLTLIDRHDVDILHTHDFRSDLFGWLAARLKRRPIVATAHGWIANDNKSRMTTAIDKLLLRRMNRVIGVSCATLRELGLGHRAPLAIVMPNALRMEQYVRVPDRSSFRDEHGIGRDEVLIANIGRLSPEKGQSEFLLAAAPIARRHPEIRLILFGTGPDRDSLQRLCTMLGLENQALFAGYRADMRLIYSELDLVVQSSYTEGMPNVVLEAMAVGVPVIASRAGGTEEIAEHETTGYLFQPGDRPALARLLERFLAHREEFLAVAERGARSVRQRFDHERRVVLLAKCYRGMLSTARAE